MNILALDLGTKCGWATNASGPVVSGVQCLTPGRYDSASMRFIRFREWLCVMRGALEFERVAYEEVRRHLGTDAAHLYGGLQAVLTMWAEESGIAYEGVPVGSIKKHATGKGNAGKAEMINAAIQRGYKPIDDNEADALALLHCVLDRASS